MTKTQKICMYACSAVTGSALSFGFFMFTAWLGIVASDKVAEHPRFYPFSIVTILICAVVFAVLLALWLRLLLKQKNKLGSAVVSALFAGAGLTVGFVAFLFLSAMAVMM